MEKLQSLAVHLEFGKILTIISIVSILLTYLIHFIFRKYPKYRLAKYSPGFIFTLVGGYSLFSLGISLPEAHEFNMLLITIIFIVAGLVGMFTGLIIGVVNKEKKT